MCFDKIFIKGVFLLLIQVKMYFFAINPDRINIERSN